LGTGIAVWLVPFGIISSKSQFLDISPIKKVKIFSGKVYSPSSDTYFRGTIMYVQYGFETDEAQTNNVGETYCGTFYFVLSSDQQAHLHSS
jgi:hypothetical protein